MDNFKKSIIISGAGGFLGRNLVNHALAIGFKVKVLINNSNPFKHLEKSLEIIQWNMDSIQKIKNFIDKGDVFVHLAAYIPKDHYDSKNIINCYNYNVLKLEELMSAAYSSGVSHFIYYSAGNAYANKVKYNKENDLLFPSGRASVYLSSKISAEFIIDHVSQLYGVPTTIFRISSPYGPNNKSIINFIIESLINKQVITLDHEGKFSADFVHIDDISNIVLKSIKNSIYGTFNIGTGRRSSLLQIAKETVDILGLKNDLIFTKKLNNDKEFETYPLLDCSKAKKTFKYNPASIVDGLIRIIK